MNWPTNNSSLYDRVLSSSDENFKVHFVTVPKYVANWAENAGSLKGKVVLEFGSNSGLISCGTALFSEPKSMLATNFAPPGAGLLEIVNARLGLESLPENLKFLTLANASDIPLLGFDFIFSWSAFELLTIERINELVEVFHDRLALGGRVLIQTGRPYYSASGAHLEEFGISNWEHLALPLSDLYRKVMASKGFSENEKQAGWSRYLSLSRLHATGLQRIFESKGFYLAKKMEQFSEIEPPINVTDIYNPDITKLNQYLLLFVKA